LMGEFEAVRSPRPAACTIPKCDRPVRARGLCATHYQEARRNGTLRNLPQPAATCAVPWCDRPPVARSLCHIHYSMWWYRTRRKGEEVPSAAVLGARRLYKCKVCGRPLVEHSLLERCG